MQRHVIKVGARRRTVKTVIKYILFFLFYTVTTRINIPGQYKMLVFFGIRF